MKYFFPCLIFFISSCSEEVSSDSDFLDNGKVMESKKLDTCFCTEIDIDSVGTHFYKETPYTGICIQHYPNSTDKYLEKNLLNGLLHGKVIYYGRDGEILIEEIYEGGNKKRSGNVDVLNCDCSELEKIESKMPLVPNRYLLDDIPYTGTCEKLYPDSKQVYMSVSYKNGILDGHSIYYNKDGSTLLIERYENGELVSALN